MILRNSSGDIMRWAPDQCDEIVSAELLRDLSQRFHK